MDFGIVNSAVDRGGPPRTIACHLNTLHNDRLAVPTYAINGWKEDIDVRGG